MNGIGRSSSSLRKLGGESRHKDFEREHDLMDDIREPIRSFIIENFLFDSDHESLNDESNLRDFLVLDSLATLTLIAFIEETFAVELHAEDLESQDTLSVANIEKLIRS